MTSEPEPWIEGGPEHDPTDPFSENYVGPDASDDDQDDAPSAPAPDLTAELVAMRHRAELAEQKANLLERQVDDMRSALRMLAAGPPRVPEPRRRWWQRKPIVAGSSLAVGAAEAAETVGWLLEQAPMSEPGQPDEDL